MDCQDLLQSANVVLVYYSTASLEVDTLVLSSRAVKFPVVHACCVSDKQQG
jgi:hypothetical protein